MRVPGWTMVRSSRVLTVAGELWRAGYGRAVRVVRSAHRAWRRSLHLRVVTITLVASSLLVGAFGVFVASRSADILLARAQDDVQARLRNGVTYATGQLIIHRVSYEADLQKTIDNTVVYLAGGGSEQHGGLVVAMRAHRYPGHLKPKTAPNADADADALITPELIATVAERGQLAEQIRTGNLDGKGTRKYLVYGSPVPTKFGQLELYYLAPLAPVDRAANLIRTTVLFTGLALVLLLGVLAALVTRLVVTPVRVAARTAKRLSAGLLDQRMVVNGEDDLALLASSFNQMAANLQRQIVRLEEMSRLQRRFTSDVSHELRTPLTTVRMAADLIFAERDEFEPAVSRSAELLQAELDRFEELLTDLLEISRFDAGFAMLDSEPTDMVPLVRRVADRLAGVAERAGVPIVLDMPDTAVIAEIDPRRVERILRNLVGNAVEHGEGRPVELTLAASEAAVAVTVRDLGVGLKPGEEKLVFNRFWRADPSRARQTGGTGLGLSISVEDARLHGGWLEAWGAPGAGAQFRLTLPVRAGDRLTSSPLRLVPTDHGPLASSAAGADASAPGPVEPSGPVAAGVEPSRSGVEPSRPVAATAGSGPSVVESGSGAPVGDRAGRPAVGEATEVAR